MSRVVRAVNPLTSMYDRSQMRPGPPEHSSRSLIDDAEASDE